MAGGLAVCVDVCGCARRVCAETPQTEVRRSPEQAQIELNLIPHCAGTGMKLHNCNLICDRTPTHLLPAPPHPTPPLPSPMSVAPSFFFFLCVTGLKSHTWAGRRDCLLASLHFFSFFFCSSGSV